MTSFQQDYAKAQPRAAVGRLPYYGGCHMTSWKTWYWPVYNVLVKALGLVALGSGAVYIAWGAARTLEWEFIGLEQAAAVAILPVGLLVAALGAAILHAPTYRPDLGDVLWQFDPFGTKSRPKSSSKRSWWTGEPLTKSRRRKS
jgi:hypothetical protein